MHLFNLKINNFKNTKVSNTYAYVKKAPILTFADIGVISSSEFIRHTSTNTTDDLSRNVYECLIFLKNVMHLNETCC